MISDLDETIRQLLIGQGGLDPVEIDIKFDIPDREWAATISKPTINCYLYDIHENRQLRSNEWVTERDGLNGVRKRRAPWRIDLSYLITAWTKAVEDEHRLLWHVLAVLFRYPSFPVETLQGVLADNPVEIPTSVAQAEGPLRSLGEFWSALDNKLKPSLNYVVTLPLDPTLVTVAPLVFGAEIRAGQLPSDPVYGTANIAGIVRGAEGNGVAAARVLFIGTNHATTTDREGRYAFQGVPVGRHMVAIAVPGRAGQPPQRPLERELTVPAATYDLDIREDS
jgi:hypothetical protein